MKLKEKFNNTKEAKKERGEVFTPTSLVNEMLDKLPSEVFTDKTKTFLDNSCGNGQFLVNVLQRKMANGIPYIKALSTIYGCELDEKNAMECRKRLIEAGNFPKKKDKSKKTTNPKAIKAAHIVKNNIICADALDENHEGWKKVGFYWNKQG